MADNLVFGVVEHAYIEPHAADLEGGDVYIVECSGEREAEEFVLSVRNDRLHNDWSLVRSGTREVPVYVLQSTDDYNDAPSEEDE